MVEMVSEAADEFKDEVARVSKLISETHHSAVAAIFMGGTGADLIAKRDRLMGVLKRACLASDDKRDEALSELRGLN